MKKYRISYVLVFLMTGTLFMHNPNVIYTAVFLTVVLVPVLSGAAFCLSKMKVEKAEVKAEAENGSDAEVHCGEDVVLTLKVIGTSTLWIGRMEAELKICNLFTGEDRFQKVSLFTGKNGFVGTTGIRSEECGCLEISLYSLKALDLTGIWTRRLSLYAETCIYVFPDLEQGMDLSRIKPITFHKSGVFGRKTTEEISGYREYMPGDPMNLIHWKLSAKTGKLLLKTFDRDPEEEILLLLDFRGKSSLTSEEKNKMVGSLSEASRRLALQKRAHWIGCIGKGGIRKFSVANVKTQKAAFQKLLRVPIDFAGAAAGGNIRKDWKCGGNVIYLFTEKQKTKTGG